MTIRFENVIPKPLLNDQHSDTSVWDNQFELKQGLFYLLNASSGKGKSTFSNILYGLRHDFSGHVWYDNKSINEFSIENWSDFRQTKMSAVFQTLDLFLDLSVIDNLLIKNRLTDYKSESDIHDMLKALGIEKLKNKATGTLSIGQQQRVSIIRSLCQPFEWLFLDEPFSHLDTNNINMALDMLLPEINRQNAGTILTTLGSDYQIENYDQLFL